MKDLVHIKKILSFSNMVKSIDWKKYKGTSLENPLWRSG